MFYEVSLFLKNEFEVQNLEELKKYFDIEKIYGYLYTGQLSRWLEERGYEREKEELRKYSLYDAGLAKALCQIFDVVYKTEYGVKLNALRPNFTMNGFDFMSNEKEPVLALLSTNSISGTTPHEEKIAIMKKYAQEIKTTFEFYIKGDIPSKKIDNALKIFASGLDRQTIIGFYDTTVLGNGKEGYIFTDDKVYYKEQLSKPQKLWYDDIKNVKLTGFISKYSDERNVLCFELYDGTIIEWNSIFLNKTPLLHFFEEIIAFEKSREQNTNRANMSINIGKTDESTGAFSAGIVYETYKNVNKSYDEEKFHAEQGHGFAAERANNQYDRFTGHDAHIVGDDNAKNGADRIVDGVNIQSKYCGTGSRCVQECFEDGGKGDFRYYSNNGKPMQIEVPSDKYEDAVKAMKVKIERGQIKGVSDPNEAENIVKKGHYTYEQAKNIAKAGTIESLKYDAADGIITATSAMGISAIIALATSVWNGDDFDTALKNAAYTGIKVGGTAFLTTIISGQLTKAGLNSALVGSTETITKMMGPKAYQALYNAFRSGSNVYGGAAIKGAAKILRGNIITAGVTVIVLSSVDVADIFRGRISGKQLFKNLTNTVTTTAGGTAGFLGGQMAIPIPIVGGIIGAVAGGAAASKVSNAVIGNFIEDDAEQMVRIVEKEFGCLAENYLLNRKEAEKTADRLKEKLDGKKLKEMFSRSDRSGFARDLIEPIMENEVKKRKHIETPTDKQIMHGLTCALEELYDECCVAT